MRIPFVLGVWPGMSASHHERLSLPARCADKMDTNLWWRTRKHPARREAARSSTRCPTPPLHHESAWQAAQLCGCSAPAIPRSSQAPTRWRKMRGKLRWCANRSRQRPRRAFQARGSARWMRSALPKPAPRPRSARGGAPSKNCNNPRACPKSRARPAPSPKTRPARCGPSTPTNRRQARAPACSKKPPSARHQIPTPEPAPSRCRRLGQSTG
mmetsp:Transcript_44136/g.133762  ORF Transcript_44136/g.133762 Transcript_44136/m.133762 type:complete len:213 (+) Transcript_44136:893-1531(+)